METKAWMLRNDGKAFPCMHHLYVMNDEDLSSEAEVAAFIYTTNSADKEYAAHVLDCWMALLVEDTLPYDYTEDELDEEIRKAVKSLPYRFLYPISIEELLKIRRAEDSYNDIDQYHEFVDGVRNDRESISNTIKKSLNQQFCRVRYGGQYDSRGTSDIWFRISSVGFNWADVIYIFTAENYRKLKVDRIYICRDYESDNGEEPGKPEYFYRAKDGAVYFNMPIDEYLQEEHEHSPVFSSVNIGRGVLASMYDLFKRGKSYLEATKVIGSYSIVLGSDPWSYFVRKESLDCIDCSDFLERAGGRTQAKMGRIISKIMNMFPEIATVDIDVAPYENNAGKMTGVKYIFDLEFDDPNAKDLTLDIPFTKGDVTPDVVARRFRQEYSDYKKFSAV